MVVERGERVQRANLGGGKDSHGAVRKGKVLEVARKPVGEVCSRRARLHMSDCIQCVCGGGGRNLRCR